MISPAATTGIVLHNNAMFREEEECMRGGHVTGSFTGGSREGLQRGRETQFRFSEY